MGGEISNVCMYTKLALSALGCGSFIVNADYKSCIPLCDSAIHTPSWKFPQIDSPLGGATV